MCEWPICELGQIHYTGTSTATQEENSSSAGGFRLERILIYALRILHNWQWSRINRDGKRYWWSRLDS